MTGALVILAALVVIGALLYITDVKYFRHHHTKSETLQKSPTTDSQSIDTSHSESGGQDLKEPEVCCGMHLVCEKTSLALVTDEIVYYDDEELDRFAGRIPESYTPLEIEEFRDVLMTMLPQDVPGWARSISLRKIEFPPEVKDELLLIVSELRSVEKS